MTNEAVRLVAAGTAPANPIRFSVVDGEGIEKGTLLKFSGSYMVKACAGLGDAFAGIANQEKVANDGSTTIGVDTCGIFDCFVDCAGTSNPGDLLITSGANMLTALRTSGLSGSTIFTGGIVGKALEEATGTGDTIAVAIGIY